MSRQVSRIVLFVFLTIAMTACGDPAGTPCQISGGGFTSSHNCSTKCLSRWSVQCPDGESVLPAMCAGREDCEPGGCSDGQLCYYFDDPFEKRSYCVPNTVCGAALPEAAARQWEIDAKRLADASRAATDERRRLREQAIESGQPKTSAPAADTEPRE